MINLSDWHVHTTISNCCHETSWKGAVIVERASTVGIKRLGITDHFYPGDDFNVAISGARSVKDAAAVDNIEIYSALEVEVINADGKLAAEPKELSRLDYVLAPAGHMRLAWVRKAALAFKTILDYLYHIHMALCGNPWVNVIAHPWLALHVDQQKEFDVSFRSSPRKVPERHIQELCQTASETDTALEINCCDSMLLPDYLDLIQRMIGFANRYDTKLSLGSDAHKADDINNVPNNWQRLSEMGLLQNMLWDTSNVLER